MIEQLTTSNSITPVPPDDPKRNIVIARPNTDQNLSHLGLVGDTYTILLSGDDTDGRYCRSTCTSRPAAVLHPTGTILRSLSPSLKARSKSPSAAKSASCAPGQ